MGKTDIEILKETNGVKVFMLVLASAIEAFSISPLLWSEKAASEHKEGASPLGETP